jgi:hypothetical protein
LRRADGGVPGMRERLPGASTLMTCEMQH